MTRLFFSARSSRAARTKVTAFTSRDLPAFQKKSWSARNKFCPIWKNPNSRRKETCDRKRDNAANCKISRPRRKWICSEGEIMSIKSIEMTKGNGGLPLVKIRTPSSTAEIYLHGAHITGFQKNG